eukprot:3397182-Rhodomonas_salina.1
MAGAAAHLRKCCDDALQKLREYETVNEDMLSETNTRVEALVRAAQAAVAIETETTTPAREERMMQLSAVLTEVGSLFGMSDTIGTRLLGQYGQGGPSSLTRKAASTRAAYGAFLKALIQTINSFEHVERLFHTIPQKKEKARGYIRDTLEDVGVDTFAELNSQIIRVNAVRAQTGNSALRLLQFSEATDTV